MKDLSFSNLNDLYGSQLSKRQYEILKSYYDFDLSLSEIADNYGITRQAVCDALKKGESNLLKFENDFKFFAKLNKIKEEAENAMRHLDSGDNESAKKSVGNIAEII